VVKRRGGEVAHPVLLDLDGPGSAPATVPGAPQPLVRTGT